MSDTPERIWAFYTEEIGLDYDHAKIVAYEKPQPCGQEYTRTDMADAAIERAKREARNDALREAADRVSAECVALPYNSASRSYNAGVRDAIAVIRALADDPAAVAEIVGHPVTRKKLYSRYGTMDKPKDGRL